MAVQSSIGRKISGGGWTDDEETDGAVMMRSEMP